ncbi:MAG: DUF4384 domain-containing protein [Gemmatimonadota bacterium]|nr:DUF4384 domain-containing protein [Gemmatimonadota bacterium]MDH5758116.1 DUF4384 domain-containing protein [Gemmatimonadota bacterium]
MKIHTYVSFFASALLLLPTPGSGQEGDEMQPIEARVWLDRGAEPVLQRGERVRVYYRTSEDAYVAIFRIDTDGSVRLLHPRGPGEDSFTVGGRDYRLLFPESPYWFVEEFPGLGYFFIVASPEPFDFSSFDHGYPVRGWDLSQVGRTVYSDPYVAMDDYVAELIPDWEYTPYGLDFVTYHVGQTYEYPRFLCYDCHGYRTYATWNPYSYSCSTLRVVIWDDPYYYPAYRYDGSRVVFASPERARPRFEFARRAAGDPGVALVRRRDAPGPDDRRSVAMPKEPADESTWRRSSGIPRSSGQIQRRPSASSSDRQGGVSPSDSGARRAAPRRGSSFGPPPEGSRAPEYVPLTEWEGEDSRPAVRGREGEEVGTGRAGETPAGRGDPPSRPTLKEREAGDDETRARAQSRPSGGVAGSGARESGGRQDSAGRTNRPQTVIQGTPTRRYQPETRPNAGVTEPRQSRGGAVAPPPSTRQSTGRPSVRPAQPGRSSGSRPQVRTPTPSNRGSGVRPPSTGSARGSQARPSQGSSQGSRPGARPTPPPARSGQANPPTRRRKPGGG